MMLESIFLGLGGYVFFLMLSSEVSLELRLEAFEIISSTKTHLLFVIGSNKYWDIDTIEWHRFR